jgi:hypothetical protein
MQKLSEAIRAGAKEHRQCFDWYFIATNAAGAISQTSAIGAAIYAAFGDIFLQGMFDGKPKPEDQLKARFPVLNKVIGEGDNAGTVYEWIQILNHQNRWKREKIAGWLEQFEEEI